MGAKLSVLLRAIWIAALCAVPPVFAQSVSKPDADLRRATEALISGKLGNSFASATDVLKAEPNSRLAHWLHAQSMIVLSGKSVEIGESDSELIEEARARLDVAPAGKLPRNLVVMPKSAERNIPVLLVDASRSKIYVFVSHHGKPVLRDEFYTTIGLSGVDKFKEGDQKTPLGVYRVQYEIRDPRKDGFLGKFAMTLDYPNAFDNHSGRTGNGIWIHGVPKDLHVRPPKASDGCLAVSNRDLQKLRRLVRFNESQIVVVPKVDWIEPEAWTAQSARAAKEFIAVASGPTMGGVFFVEEKWPWVVSLLQGNQVQRRVYFQRLSEKIELLLGEDLS